MQEMSVCRVRNPPPPDTTIFDDHCVLIYTTKEQEKKIALAIDLRHGGVRLHATSFRKPQWHAIPQ